MIQERISLDAILFAFFKVIDVTLTNAQGHDFGSQYKTGIYYTNQRDQKVVEGIANIIRARNKKFAVEIKLVAAFL
jgi:peptide methionine sulfoxide reductase msrA/msrB